MRLLDHPYHNMDQGLWLKGNLHAHTRFSDGQLTHQQLADAYAGLNYDFLGYTDHDHLTDDLLLQRIEDRGMILLTGNEISAGGPHILHVHAGMQVRPMRQRQGVIDAINRDQGFAIINHPNQGPRFDHHPINLLKQLHGYAGMEIFNGACGKGRGEPYALNKWDMILAEGRKVWGFASDDAHTPDDIGLGWNMVLAETRSRDALLQAMVTGRFYASTGVVIESIEVEQMTVRIRTVNAQRIVVIATGGKRVAVEDSNQIEVQVPEHVRYVRFTCWGAGEEFAWTQPFFVRTVAGS